MRLTLFQMMKIIVGFSLATACMVPLVRCAEFGMMSWTVTLTVGSIIVPLAYALAAMLIAQRDANRDRQVWAYCLVASSVALGIAVYYFSRAVSFWVSNSMLLRGPLKDRLQGATFLLALTSIFFIVILRGSVRSWRAASAVGVPDKGLVGREV